MTRGVRVCVIAVVAVLTLAALPVSPLKVTDSNQSHMELRGNRSIVKDPEMNDKSDIMSHSLYLGDLAMQNRGKPSKNKGKPSKNKGKPSKNKGKPSKNKGKPSKNKGKPSKNKGKHAMRGRSCKKCKKNPRKNVELSPWESVCISVRRGKGAFPEKWTLKVKPPAWSPWHLNITCPRIYGKYRKGQGPPVFSITEGEKSSWQVHDSKAAIPICDGIQRNLTQMLSVFSSPTMVARVCWAAGDGRKGDLRLADDEAPAFSAGVSNALMGAREDGYTLTASGEGPIMDLDLTVGLVLRDPHSW
ncbi:uncharacterized protein LOC121862502 [Homarus americanus]|uniref:uncharacterized protein LOC121862502 n=1 Tax=Homarus americanus TaxID=6706 RepID=UPI001C48195F|nr:uncharacterized protein LOC121862502 [Homarus americanus]